MRLDLRWIPPGERPNLFCRQRYLVVLPYRRILNSGGVVVVLTFERPVLVPDLGAVRDQQEAFGADWVRLYAGDLIEPELAAAIDWARTAHRQAIELDCLDWRTLALRTREAYAAVVSRQICRSW